MAEKTEQQKALEEARKTPRTRAEAGAALLVQGASFKDVAEMLGYSTPSSAKQAVEKVLAHSLTVPEREAMRSVVHQRYERLLKSVMPRATNPRDTQHLAYNARANAIIDRMSKLHGLDAPTQVQVTPSEEYLDQYTRQLQSRMGLDPDVVEEADIFEDMGEADG